MEWEDKVKLVQLGNQNDGSPEKKKEFQDYVLENVVSFDDQAWSMFSLSTTIITDEIKEDLQYWAAIHPYLKKVNLDSPVFGMADSMRLSMLQVICKDELGLN